MEYALKLNADYSPIEVVSGFEALILVFSGKADLVEGFDRFMRSVSAEFQIPSVIRLRKYSRRTGKLGCSRENILARDLYTCQYCGVRPRTATGKPRLEELTLDHVIPRSAAKNKRVFIQSIQEWRPVSSWENLVCACDRCNNKKGSKTLEKAGLRLRAIPRDPGPKGRAQVLLNRYPIQEDWKEYLPKNSEWRYYWEAELED